jgi:hypothetical protein
VELDGLWMRVRIQYISDTLVVLKVQDLQPHMARKNGWVGLDKSRPRAHVTFRAAVPSDLEKLADGLQACLAQNWVDPITATATWLLENADRLSEVLGNESK